MKFGYADSCGAEGLPEASDEELALMTKIMDKITVDLDLAELGVPVAGVAKTRYKRPFKDRVYACVLLLIFLSLHVSILMFNQWERTLERISLRIFYAKLYQPFVKSGVPRFRADAHRLDIGS